MHSYLTLLSLFLLLPATTTATIDPPSYIFRLLASPITITSLPPNSPFAASAPLYLETSSSGVAVLNFTRSHKGFDVTNSPVTITPGKPGVLTRGGLGTVIDGDLGLEFAELGVPGYLLPLNSAMSTGMYQLAFGGIPKIAGVLSANFTTDRRTPRCPVGQESCNKDLWYDLEGAQVPGSWWATPLGADTWSVQWAQPTLKSRNLKAGVPPVGSVELTLETWIAPEEPEEEEEEEGEEGEGGDDGGDGPGVPEIPVTPGAPGAPDFKRRRRLARSFW